MWEGLYGGGGKGIYIDNVWNLNMLDYLPWKNDTNKYNWKITVKNRVMSWVEYNYIIFLFAYSNMFYFWKTSTSLLFCIYVVVDCVALKIFNKMLERKNAVQGRRGWVSSHWAADWASRDSDDVIFNNHTTVLMTVLLTADPSAPHGARLVSRSHRRWLQPVVVGTFHFSWALR